MADGSLPLTQAPPPGPLTLPMLPLAPLVRRLGAKSAPAASTLAEALRYGPGAALAMQKSQYLADALANLENPQTRDIRTPAALGINLLAEALLQSAKRDADKKAIQAYQDGLNAEVDDTTRALGGPSQPPASPTQALQIAPNSHSPGEQPGSPPSFAEGSDPNAGLADAISRSAPRFQMGASGAPSLSGLADAIRAGGPVSMGADGAPQVSSQNKMLADIIMNRDPAGSPASAPSPTPPPAQPDQTAALWPALEQQESGGNQAAISPRGAFGVAQLMPATAAEMATKLGDPSLADRARVDPDVNRQLGQAYLQEQEQRFGHPALALAAYNAGPGRVNQWLQQYGDPRSGQVTDQQWVQSIPFPSTRAYVHAILSGQAPPQLAQDSQHEANAGPQGPIQGGAVQPFQIAANGPALPVPTQLPAEVSREPQDFAPGGGMGAQQPPAPMPQASPWSAPAPVPMQGGVQRPAYARGVVTPEEVAEYQREARNPLTQEQGRAYGIELRRRAAGAGDYEQRFDASTGNTYFVPKNPAAGAPFTMGPPTGWQAPAEPGMSWAADGRLHPKPGMEHSAPFQMSPSAVGQTDPFGKLTVGAVPGAAGEAPPRTYWDAQRQAYVPFAQPTFGSPVPPAGGQGPGGAPPSQAVQSHLVPIGQLVQRDPVTGEVKADPRLDQAVKISQEAQASPEMQEYAGVRRAYDSLVRAVNASTGNNGLLDNAAVDTVIRNLGGRSATVGAMQIWMSHMGLPQHLQGEISNILGTGYITPESLRQAMSIMRTTAQGSYGVAQDRASRAGQTLATFGVADPALQVAAVPDEPQVKWLDGGRDRAAPPVLTPGQAARLPPGTPYRDQAGNPQQASGAPPAAQLPPPQHRAPGVYPTPRGPMRWTGTGWRAP